MNIKNGKKFTSLTFGSPNYELADILFSLMFKIR